MKEKKNKKRLSKQIKMEEMKQNQILTRIFLLLIGIIIGITISLNGTFALDTSTASNATSSNATSSNATSSNATSSNATSSNATSSNATSSNVQKTDNIMYLNSFSLGANSATVGDKVYINKNTSGACNTAISITFKESTNGNTFTVNVENVNNNPYFIVPENVISGNYSIEYAFFVGLNSNNTTFTKKFGLNNKNGDITEYNFDIKLSIKGNETNKVELKKLTLANNSTKIGDKVNISLSTSETLTSLKLLFKSERGNEFTVYVNNLNNTPYFIVPTTTKTDNYYLYQATLISGKTSNIYTNDNNYEFNTILEVKSTSEKTYIYNNNDINNDIIKSIYNENEKLEITINANDNPIISSELFNAIKGTKKKLIINYKDNQIVFCGNDIESSKSIDVSITTNNVSQDKNIEKTLKEGIVINFASNGNLPGNALIKIKTTAEMKNSFGNNKVYVYYYDEEKNAFSIVARKISMKDGYYEFSINHNSKYVLTKKALSDKMVLNKEDNIVGFQQSNKYYLLWIFAATILCAIVIGIIVIINKRKGKN